MGEVFAAPQWLWALPVLVLVYALFVFDERRRKRRLAQFAEATVWEMIVPELDWRARFRKARLWCIALAFVFLALAKPQWGKHEEIIRTTGLDLVLVLDVSRSMDVEDVIPSRMKKAKHLARTLLDRLDGDRVGVVAFAGSAYLATPLTTYLEYVSGIIDGLGPDSIQTQGTDIGAGLEIAANALSRGAEDLTKIKAAVPTKAIVLISDGEDWGNEIEQGIQKIQSVGAELFVLGVGTEKGGPIPVRDPDGVLHGYKRSMETRAPIISTFRPDTLMKVAGTENRYWTASPSEGEIDDILAELGKLDRTEKMDRTVITYQSRYQIPLGIAIFLMLLEVSLPARRMLRKKIENVAIDRHPFPVKRVRA